MAKDDESKDDLPPIPRSKSDMPQGGPDLSALLKRVNESLKQIRAPDDAPDTKPSREYEAEKTYLRRQQKKQELEDREHAAHVEGVENYHKNRALYTKRIYRMVRNWMIAVVLIVFVSGFNAPELVPDGAFPFWYWLAEYELSDSVLMMLLGTTTANVIAVFVIVARFLFPRDGHRGYGLASSTQSDSD